MSSIQIDNDPTSLTFNDIKIVNGDLVLISGVDEVTQEILCSLRTFLGEWFLDNSIGVPWFQQVFVKNVEKSVVDALIINTICSVPGVQTLLSYTSTINTSTRAMTISFKAQSTSGIVNYSGSV